MAKPKATDHLHLLVSLSPSVFFCKTKHEIVVLATQNNQNSSTFHEYNMESGEERAKEMRQITIKSEQI